MTKKKKSAKRVKFANGIFLIGSMLCLLIIGHSLWKRNLYPAEIINTYYIASVIGLTLCIIGVKLKDDINIKYAFGITSVILTLYLVEFSLFLWEPKPWIKHFTIIKKAAKEAGISYDNRSKWQVIQDLRKKGVDAYPLIFPHRLPPNGLMSNTDKIFVLGSISNKTTVLCNESGEYVIYLADKYGFNNPPESLGPDQPDLMLVGDSFVLGQCVNQGEDIAGQLRKLGWKALNLGMGGNGPLFMLATIKEYAEPMKPKNVLWFYYEDNDLVDFQKEKNSAFLMQYLHEDFSQDLVHRQAEVDQVLRQYVEEKIKKYKPKHRNDIIDIIKLKYIRFRIKRLKHSSFGNKPFQIPSPEPLFREILKKARDRVSAWGGKLYFVYLPMWARYSKDVDHNQWRHRRKVLSIVRELEIPIIDIHEEVFLKHADPLSLFPFSLYGHYNKKGYNQIAEAIDKHLIEK